MKEKRRPKMEKTNEIVKSLVAVYTHTCSFKRLKNSAIVAFKNRKKKDNLDKNGYFYPLLM